MDQGERIRSRRSQSRNLHRSAGPSRESVDRNPVPDPGTRLSRSQPSFQSAIPSRGQECVMQRKSSNPPTMHKPIGYSHVAEVSEARLVFIAGQVALDANGALVGEGDYAKQVRHAFSNF